MLETEHKEVLSLDDIEVSLSYSEYRKLIDQLLLSGKTTGENHSEAMIQYTRMNVARMRKWDKIFSVSDSLVEQIEKIRKPQIWIILTEGWCGDAAQSIPQLVKLAGYSENVGIRFLLRDENSQLMDQYLTNGSKSIPKLVAVDRDTRSELFHWGPRPAPAQKIVMESKRAGRAYKEYVEELHLWYAKDKGVTLQQEIEALIASIH